MQASGGGQEDCLYLHVHVPERVANGSVAGPVPVMVYIHGGGLMDGGGQFEHLGPLAAHLGPDGVVVVAINYRLNIFGWLAVAELSAESPTRTSGNYGLLDQQLALRWVEANVGSFGGDPSRVTVAGQSSGGTSIFALLCSPASRGLFHGAIALSGSINVSMSLAAGHAQNAPVVEAAGCARSQGGGATAAERLACLRALPASALVAAIPNAWNTPGMWGLELLNQSGMAYQGLPVVDGVVITHSFRDALAAGLVDVPLMFGNMEFESDLGPDVDVSSFNQAQWQAHLNESVASWDTSFPDIGADLYAAYENASISDPDKAYTAFNTDYGLTCGSAAIAIGAKSGEYKSPIYLFVGKWSPETPIPGSGRFVSYAYHTWDYQCACEAWADAANGGDWVPGSRDLAYSKALRGWWFDLMDDGQLNEQTGSKGLNSGDVDDSGEAGLWASVEAAVGFPAHWNTFVMAPPGSIEGGSKGVVDFKGGICADLSAWGFDDRFWWCN